MSRSTGISKVEKPSPGYMEKAPSRGLRPIRRAGWVWEKLSKKLAKKHARKLAKKLAKEHAKKLVK